MVAAEGVRLKLADGRELIDGIANWWSACHGHGHPHIRQAVAAQLDRFPHLMFAGLAHEPAYRLAERLTARVPGDFTRVFFTESGSVSVEVALKMALQSWMIAGKPDKRRVLGFRGGYHGDTLGTMPLCDPEEGMHAMFAGVFTPALLADLPIDDAAEAALDAPDGGACSRTGGGDRRAPGAGRRRHADAWAARRRGPCAVSATGTGCS